MKSWFSKMCFSLSRTSKNKLLDLKRLRVIKEQQTSETQSWLRWKIIFLMFVTGGLISLGMKCLPAKADGQ